MSAVRSRSGGRCYVDNIEPVIEVFPEAARPDFFLQVLVGRRDDPCIRAKQVPATDPVIIPLCQNPQQAGLQGNRHIPYFVEEQRPACGFFKSSDSAGMGAGKSTFFMPEKFGFKQFRRDRGAIDGHERRIRPGAVLVKNPRHYLFATAGFAGNQHADIGA